MLNVIRRNHEMFNVLLPSVPHHSLSRPKSCRLLQAERSRYFNAFQPPCAIHQPPNAMTMTRTESGRTVYCESVPQRSARVSCNAGLDARGRGARDRVGNEREGKPGSGLPAGRRVEGPGAGFLQSPDQGRRHRDQEGRPEEPCRSAAAEEQDDKEYLHQSCSENGPTTAGRASYQWGSPAFG